MGKELLDWFGYSEETASVSAFVQQRNKIKPDDLKCIFQTMISQCDKHTLYNGYHLLAVDGSNLRLPSDKRELPIGDMNPLITLLIVKKKIGIISSAQKNPMV